MKLFVPIPTNRTSFFFQTAFVGLGFACCCVGGGGCGDATTPSDAGMDADVSIVVEIGVDGPADKAVEPDQAGGDVALDGLYDIIATDLVAGDASLSPGTVLYAVGTDPHEFGLRTVAADGTTQPTAVSGFGGLIDFDPLKLTALLDQPALSSKLPRPTRPGPFAGIKLPGEGGVLYYFHRKLTGTSGLLVVRPDGSHQVVVEVFGLYVDVISEHIALSSDGTVGLALHGNEVLLFRTDATMLPGGKPSVVLGFSGDTPPEKVFARSLTVAGDWVFCVASYDSGARQLLRAPTDGSADLEPVPLPEGAGGGELTFVGEEIASARSRSHLAIIAGTAAVATDVLVVDVAAGTAVRVNEKPNEVAARGERYGGLTAQLAISPQGTKIAYVAKKFSLEEMFVVDLSVVPNAAVQVTDESRFQSTVQRAVNLRFIDEENLLFMAGATGVQLDVYRYETTTQQVSVLTGLGALPFGPTGTFEPYGAWLGSTRAFFWVHDGATGKRALIAVDLQSFVAEGIFDISGSVDVERDVVACDGGSVEVVFFVVQLATAFQRELWGFEAATKVAAPVKVAGAPNSGPWTTTAPMVSPDCTQVLFSAGGDGTLRILWRAPTVAGTGGVHALTAVPRWFSESYGVTTDGQTVVFASGGTEGKTTLRAVAVGGTPAVLDPAAGAVHIFTVY